MTVLAVIASYLLGSVPTGLWLGLRLRSIDIREHGSKNIGATNTMRVLGKGLGGVALAADVAKGAAAVYLGMALSNWGYGALACGIAAILGHTLSVFLKFRGGKGVATSAGVFLALCPTPTGIAVAVFLAVVGVTRMVSAGSICAAIALSVAVFLLTGDPVLQGLATAVALFVIVKHRSNIGRILRSEESRLGGKGAPPPPPPDE